MTKLRGPEDFSSSNCQVLVCCRELCSLSHPIYISFFLFLIRSVSWRMRLAWSDAGREGTRSEETPAALWEQSHPVRPRLVKSGVMGPAEHPRVMEDACPDAAATVACVDDAVRRCLLVSLPLPSCTPCGGMRDHD